MTAPLLEEETFGKGPEGKGRKLNIGLKPMLPACDSCRLITPRGRAIFLNDDETADAGAVAAARDDRPVETGEARSDRASH